MKRLFIICILFLTSCQLFSQTIDRMTKVTVPASDSTLFVVDYADNGTIHTRRFHWNDIVSILRDSIGVDNYVAEGWANALVGQYLTTSAGKITIPNDTLAGTLMQDSTITKVKLSPTVNALLSSPGSGTYAPDEISLEFKIVGVDTTLQIKNSYMTTTVFDSLDMEKLKINSVHAEFGGKNLAQNVFMRFRNTFYDDTARIHVASVPDNPYSDYAIWDTLTTLGQYINLEQDSVKYVSCKALIMPWDSDWSPNTAYGIWTIKGIINGVVDSTFYDETNGDSPTWATITDDSTWQWIEKTLTLDKRYDSLYVGLGGGFASGDTFYTAAFGVFNTERPPDEFYGSDIIEGLTNSNHEIEVGTDGFIDISDSVIDWSNLDSTTVKEKIRGDVQLFLPDTIYASVGYEHNVYFRNIIFPNPDFYHWVTECDTLRDDGFIDVFGNASKGEHFKWGWRFTPTKDDTIYDRTLPLKLAIHVVDNTKAWADNSNDIFISDTTNIIVLDTVFTAPDTLLLIGDSYTNWISPGVGDSAKYVGPLIDMCDNNAIPIGGQDSGTGYDNEGHTGRNLEWIASNVSSPFVNASGHTDVAAYFTDTGFNDPKWVVIEFTINDVAQAYSAANTTLKINNALAELDSLVDDFLVELPSAFIGISLLNQTGYDYSDYSESLPGVQSGYRYSIIKDRIHKMRTAIWERYGVGGTHYDTQVSLIPFYCGVDTENNFPTTTKVYNARNSNTYTTLSDAIHPAESGFKQIADYIYGWLLWHQ